MPVFAGAQELRILIGTDNQDWSRFRIGFDAGYAERGAQPGLAPITGKMQIIGHPQTPERIDPRKNPARWRKGQIVIIDYLDGTTWTRHKFGHLYILKEPSPPQYVCDPANPTRESGEITLELGCRLALANSEKLDADKSGVALGSNLERGAIITNLLTASNCPALTGAIQEWPINYPLPKDGGSFVAQAGEIAYAAGYELHQDRFGNIKAKPLRHPFVDLPVDLVLNLANDIARYEPLSGSETPVEKAKAVGVSQTAKDATEIKNYSSVDSGPANSVNPEYIGWTDLRRTVGTHRINQNGRSSQEQVEELAGIVFSISEKGSFAWRWRSTTNYAQHFGEFLTYEESVTEQPLEAIAKDYIQSLSGTTQYNEGHKSVFTRNRTDYFYDDKKRCIKKIQTETAPFAAIVGNQAPISTQKSGNELTKSQISEEWYPFGEGWLYKRVEKEAAVVTRTVAIPGYPTEVFVWVSLETKVNKTESSKQGNQPPAAEVRPDQYERTETPISGEATFLYTPGQTVERERVWEVKYADNTAQLEAIAKLEGAFLIGRRQGQLIQGDLTAAIMASDGPYPLIKVVDTCGDELYYVGDAFSITHDARTAVFGCNGVWVATKLAAQTAPRLPYISVISIGIVPATNFTPGGTTAVIAGPLIRLQTSASRVGAATNPSVAPPAVSVATTVTSTEYEETTFSIGGSGTTPVLSIPSVIGAGGSLVAPTTQGIAALSTIGAGSSNVAPVVQGVTALSTIGGGTNLILGLTKPSTVGSGAAITTGVTLPISQPSIIGSGLNPSTANPPITRPSAISAGVSPSSSLTTGLSRPSTVGPGSTLIVGATKPSAISAGVSPSSGRTDGQLRPSVVGSSLNAARPSLVDALIAQIAADGSPALATAEVDALSAFISALTANGTLSKYRAIYTFPGSTAATQRYNLLNAQNTDAAYRLTFGVDITHASTGVTPAGTPGSDTATYFAMTNLPQNSARLAYYNRSTGTGTFTLMGEIGAATLFLPNYPGFGAYNNINGYEETARTTIGTFSGLLSISRSGTTVSSRRNGAEVTTHTFASSAPNSNPLILFGFSSYWGRTSYPCGFAAMSEGLTIAEELADYNAVQALMTALGRQV